MTDYRFDPARILAALARHAVDYVLIGGLAVIAHGSRRLTADVDIMPAREPENYARLAAALDELAVGESAVDADFRTLDPRDPFDLARARVLELETAAGPLDIVNVPKGGPVYEDLRARATETTVAGIPVAVVSLDDLIAMKRASGRPRDLRDIADLTAQE